jgi:hypothetical protein
MRIRESRSVSLLSKKADFQVRVLYTEGVNELADIMEHLGINSRVFNRILTRDVPLPVFSPLNSDIEISALRSEGDTSFVLLRVTASGGAEAEQLIKDLLVRS